MADSGLVTESTSLQGVTSVTLPPNPNAYRDAAARCVYVEFEVPADAVRAADGTTAKIYGPTSILVKNWELLKCRPRQVFVRW